MAEKVHQEKLHGLQTRLTYGESSRRNSQTQLSESESCNRKKRPKKRRQSPVTASRGTRPSQTASVFSSLRHERDKPTRQRSLVNATVFTRLGPGDKNVFTRLGERKRDVHSRLGPEDASRHKRMSRRSTNRSNDDDDLSQPWLCEEIDPFTARIRNSEVPKRTRMPVNVKTYDGTGDPNVHLKIFQAASKIERGAPECMKISGIMHEITNPDLIKKLNDNIPKSVDEMMSVTTAFLRGEVVAANQSKKKASPAWKHHESDHRPNFDKRLDFKNQHKSSRRQDRFTPLTKTPKEILAMDTPWQRITRQKTTQSFFADQEISFSTLGDDNGQETPIVIEAEVKGHLIHRMYVDGGSASEEHSASALMNFMIVKFPSPYNGIIGRPSLRKIQSVPSAAHGMLKFPVEGGISTIRITTIKAAECRMVTEAENMTGVSRSIAKHRLNVREGCPPIRQKRRGQAPDRNKAIQKEVSKPVEAKIMREVHYHDWISNPVMVKKHDGSWRMCVDFTDLNKSCPKDCYPLPKIDWNVESLCGYPFKCFLDAYKGYHQIQMENGDEEKTDFHTNQGVFCYTEMPFDLKNAGATYQRLVDKAFEKQIDRNLKVEAVMKLQSPPTLKEAQSLNGKLASLNSHALQALEIKYTSVEKVVLALVHATRRLMRPRTSIRGQVLADFIAEKPDEGGPPTEVQIEETVPEPWVLFMNGSSCSEGSGAGLILTNPEGKEFTYAIRFELDASKNEAEYEALVAGLRLAEHMGVKNLITKVDSRLVANQIKGLYEAKEQSMTQNTQKKVNRRKGNPSNSGRRRVLLDDTVGRIPYGGYPASKNKKGTRDQDQGEAIHHDQLSLIHEVIPGTMVTIRLPREIISDNGKQFREIPFKDWCEKLNIKQRFASFKHPQTNDQVERANCSLVEGIKARLGEDNRNWVEEVPHVLWAHRTMIKTSTGDTSFSLTYGIEAVIPVEIRMPSIRCVEVNQAENDEGLLLNLDILEERREKAAVREERSKAKMEKYYNAKVHSSSFRPGDFVYRSNEASHAKKSEKLGPKWEGPYEVVEALRKGAYKLRNRSKDVLPRTWNVQDLKKRYL
nr:reverse transcriptase domain-containing protein [Tanacetum cinerariifolium]